MSKVLWSQTNVYHLHRMANHVRADTGKRPKLSDEQAVIQLILDCANSENAHIREQFSNFTDSLADEQRQVLSNLGVELV